MAHRDGWYSLVQPAIGQLLDFKGSNGYLDVV
jgi:hypothetical protein